MVKITMPITLRSRLALFNTLFITCILLVSLGLIYFTLDTWVYHQIDSSLVVLARQASEGMEYKNNILINKGNVTDNELEKQRQFMRVVNVSGRVQEHFGPVKELPVVIAGVGSYSTKGSYQELTLPNDDEVFRVFTLPIIHQNQIVGFVQTGQSLETAENMLQLLIFTLLLMIPVVLLLTLLGGEMDFRKSSYTSNCHCQYG